MINELFHAGETKTNLPATGQYIFLEKSPNTYIAVRAETANGVREYTMKERETNYVPAGEEFISLSVVNTGEHAGQVVIRTGMGTFTQSNDHQKVTVDNEINLPSNINFSSPQPIYPSSTAVFNTKVQNWPSEYPVVFKGVQKVEVTNQSSPSEVHALAPVVMDGQKSIPSNAKRKGLIVLAPETNQGVVVIAGVIPLHAGGHTTIPATNALSVTGVDGDVLNVLEVR